MASRHFAFGLALLALAGGSACAMNRPADSTPRCSVAEGAKLPPESGGVEALCAEIEAATANLPVPPVVTVTAARPYFLAAKIRVGDRELPEIKFSRSDKAIDRAAFKHFAQSVANAAGKANP